MELEESKQALAQSETAGIRTEARVCAAILAAASLALCFSASSAGLAAAASLMGVAELPADKLENFFGNLSTHRCVEES